KETVFEGHTGGVCSFSFTTDSRRICSGSTDRTVRVWPLASKSSRVIRTHKGTVWSVGYSKTGDLLATASGDHSVLLGEDDFGRPKQLQHEGPVWSAAFSPNAKLVASASQDRTIRIWDVRTGKCVETHMCEAPVRHVSFSSSGSWIAS